MMLSVLGVRGRVFMEGTSDDPERVESHNRGRIPPGFHNHNSGNSEGVISHPFRVWRLDLSAESGVIPHS